MNAPRFSLRTVLVLLAILPPLLAVGWFFWLAPKPAAEAIEDDPYEIIWDDYAPDTIPAKPNQGP